MPKINDISYFFDPKSLAIIGASSKSGKVGYNVLTNIIESKYKGKIFPINPKTEEILGYKSYKSVLDVPEEIEVAIVVIPGKFVNHVAEECGKKKIKGLVIITAGFKEIGGAGIVREQELVQIAKKYDMRVIGPNCLGFIGVNYNGSFAATLLKRGK